MVERNLLRESVGRAELPWRPRAQEWDAGDYLSELSRSDLQLADENLSELEDFLWFDLCAEHDSRHLHAYLQGLPIPYTDDFRAFERLWFRDEVNHEKGFRRLYQLVSLADDSDVDARLGKRVPDFSPFQDFVQDELSLCVVFAYDELATCHAYRRDLPLYRRLNSEILPRWLQHIILDEAYHHRNALEIAVRHHGDRRSEVARIIERCVEYDVQQHSYRGTFIFDHEWEGVGPEFFRSNGARVLDLFDRAFTCS